jgi:histidinol-phosphate aminotransferase
MSRFWSTTASSTDPYVPGEQPQKQNIIKLNTNENPYPPSPKVLTAIREGVNESLRLYPSPTADDLRRTAGEFFGLSPNQVFVGNGSDEVLAFAFQAFFEPGETILFPDITYSFYPVYAKLYDLNYETVPLNEDFSVPVEKFLNAPGGVIFPNPNAPTGLGLSLAQVEYIVNHNRDRVVIVDEAYVDFGGQSAVPLIQKYQNLLVIQTLSKSRSLAGLRVGFALGQEHLIEGLNRIKNSFNSYTLDRLALIGAKAAIEDVEYFQSTTEKIITTRKRITSELRNLGFYVIESQANFIFINHHQLPAKKLYKDLKEQGIYVRYFNQSRVEDFVRVTIGTDEEMDVFLKAVREFLRT